MQKKRHPGILSFILYLSQTLNLPQPCLIIRTQDGATLNVVKSHQTDCSAPLPFKLTHILYQEKTRYRTRETQSNLFFLGTLSATRGLMNYEEQRSGWHPISLVKGCTSHVQQKLTVQTGSPNRQKLIQQ